MQQQQHLPSAPSEEEPWHLGPEPVYADSRQALHGLAPAPEHTSEPQPQWHKHRQRILRDWGAKREAEMHRPPQWCMDQLCSGSGLFPPRHLGDEWFSKEELGMIESLQRLLQPTGHAAALARDMMALRIYDVDVRIIADDSSSMSLPMLRTAQGRYGFNEGWTRADVQKVFGRRAFRPDTMAAFHDSPFSPSMPRWALLKDALFKWEEVFQILRVDRQIYLLNGHGPEGSDLGRILGQGYGGGTPTGRTLQQVLADYQHTSRPQGRPLLVLALTDGEANDMLHFNSLLDEIQDSLHGDVQVCLMGLSLDPEDIEWFEDEECDDTRIRTIEAFEVEQQMILYRKVIPRSSEYNFAMHTYRALVTNFFPADYDYEAPLQTLRHRLYITLHALDRRFTGRRDAVYPSPLSGNFATGCSAVGAAGACLAFMALPKTWCTAGLLACAFGCASANTGRGVRTSAAEEALREADDRAIGGLVRHLQRLSLEGWAPLYAPRGDYGGYGGRGPRRGGANRPWVDPRLLRHVQTAIGALSPSETQMRDLQFQDVQRNNRALDAALGFLRKAARMGRFEA